MARSRVILEERFRRHEAELRKAVVDGLAWGAQEAAREAKAVPTPYRIQGILGTIRATSVTRTRNGWAVAIESGDWRHIFFEKGTFQRRRAKLAQPGRRRSTSTQRGVKPGHFLRKGHKAAFPRMLDRIERGLRRA